MKVLVTGTKSGLGRFLHERIGGAGLSRETIIIHCAHKPIDGRNQNLGDFAINYNLTSNLLKLPHKKFIYISSVDVYIPGNQNGNSKKDCEARVREYGKEYLIIRLPLIIGKYQRPNCLSKIKNKADSISLSGDSEFYFIFDIEILFYLKKAIKENWTGDYDGIPDEIEQSGGLVLKDLAEIYNPNIKFGTFKYKADIWNQIGK